MTGCYIFFAFSAGIPFAIFALIAFEVLQNICALAERVFSAEE